MLETIFNDVGNIFEGVFLNGDWIALAIAFGSVLVASLIMRRGTQIGSMTLLALVLFVIGGYLRGVFRGMAPADSAGANRAVRLDVDRHGLGAPIVCLQANLSSPCRLLPWFWIVLRRTGKIKVPVLGFRHDETPMSGCDVRIIVFYCRRVIDLALLEARIAVVLYLEYGVMLLPAFSTEMCSEQQFIRIVGVKLLAVERHRALSRSIQGRVEPPRARNQLMQPESKQGFILTIDDAALALGRAERK